MGICSSNTNENNEIKEQIQEIDIEKEKQCLLDIKIDIFNFTNLKLSNRKIVFCKYFLKQFIQYDSHDKIDSFKKSMEKGKQITNRSDFSIFYLSILYHLEMYEDILLVSKQSLEYFDDEFNLTFLVASAQYKLGNFVAAFQKFKKCLQLEPANQRVLLNLTVCLIKLGHIEQVQEKFNILMNKYNPNPYTYLNYGEYLSFQNKFEEAEAWFQGSLKMFPKENSIIEFYMFLLIYLKKFEKVKEIYKFHQELESSNFYPDYLYGISLYHLKSYDDAITQFQFLINRKSQFADSFYYMGLCFQKKGYYQKALGFYEKAKELEPENQKIQSELRQCLFYLKQYNTLENIYSGMVHKEDYQKEGCIYFNLGIVLIHQKKFDEAIRRFQVAIDLNFQDIDVYLEIGRCYYQQQNYQKAVVYLKKGLIKSPQNEKLQRFLLKCYYSQPNVKDIVTLFSYVHSMKYLPIMLKMQKQKLSAQISQYSKNKIISLFRKEIHLEIVAFLRNKINIKYNSEEK